MGEVWSSGLVHVYLGLWREHPDNGGREVIGLGYARLAVPPAAFTPRDGAMTNRVTLSWPHALGEWGAVKCVIVHPEPTGDEGLLAIPLGPWSYGPPVYVGSGLSVEFKPWSLRISMEDWEKLSGPSANGERSRKPSRAPWWRRLVGGGGDG